MLGQGATFVALAFLSSDAYGKWAGSRETISTPVGARAFFLTSFFIELIDPMMSEMAMFCQQAQ
jgi:hypothetical protein